MASSQNTWFKGKVVVGATQIAASTLVALGVVAYTTGNTYQVGTQEVTTVSGATVTAGGGTFQATNLANAACRKTAGGRYYDCFQQTVFTNTGASVGAKYYNVASVTKPFTGSGVLERVEISCDDQPVSTVISVDQLASLTTSGVTILDRKTIGSGSLVSYVAEPRLDSTSTGATVWAESTPYVKVSARARVGNSQCVLGVWSHEMYNP